MSSLAPVVSPRAFLCGVNNSDREKQPPWYQRWIPGLRGDIALPLKTMHKSDEANGPTFVHHADAVLKPKSQSTQDSFLGQPTEVLGSSGSDVAEPSW